MSRFKDLFRSERPIIGVIHLPPLLGYPDSPGINALIESALEDLRLMEEGGLSGVLLENENDQPHKLVVGAPEIASMTLIARAVLRKAHVPVGVQFLLNDPKASIAVAYACGAAFVRTDYFVDRMQRQEYGEMTIDPKGLIEYRHSLGAEEVQIYADIQVKYAEMIKPRSLADSANQAEREGADAVIVSGVETGSPPSACELKEARSGTDQIPVLIGSGLKPENRDEILAHSDGALVGYGIKVENRIDPAKLSALSTTAV